MSATFHLRSRRPLSAAELGDVANYLADPVEHDGENLISAELEPEARRVVDAILEGLDGTLEHLDGDTFDVAISGQVFPGDASSPDGFTINLQYAEPPAEE